MKKGYIIVLGIALLLGSGCCNHEKQKRELEERIRTVEMDILQFRLKVNQKELVYTIKRFEAITQQEAVDER